MRKLKENEEMERGLGKRKRMRKDKRLHEI